VKGEVAAWAVADLVVGDRVEILVNQPGWVVVQLWETGSAGVLASKGDDCEVVLGIGKPRSLGPSRVMTWMSLRRLVR
jgi:hypothetical protein